MATAVACLAREIVSAVATHRRPSRLRQAVYDVVCAQNFATPASLVLRRRPFIIEVSCACVTVTVAEHTRSVSLVAEFERARLHATWPGETWVVSGTFHGSVACPVAALALFAPLCTALGAVHTTQFEFDDCVVHGHGVLWQSFDDAARLIQRAFRRCITNPAFAVCRARLRREFDQMTTPS